MYINLVFVTQFLLPLKFLGDKRVTRGSVKKNQGLLQIAKVPKILLNSLKSCCNFAIFRQNYFVIPS